MEPTKYTNYYDRYSPNGRGFGFDHGITKRQYHSLAVLNSVQKELPELLKKNNYILSEDHVQQFLNDPAVVLEAKKKLPLVDCHNLGITKYNM